MIPVLILSFAWVPVAHAVPSGEDGAVLRNANAALNQADVERARELFNPLLDDYGDDPDVLYTHGVLLFHEGEYASAFAAVERAIALGPTAPGLSSRRELATLIATTLETTRSFVTHTSRNGQFQVRLAPGPDEVLVPYALHALERSYDTLSVDLGVTLPVVRLEIVPTADALAAVSTLTIEEIERTGTIALCKWNRLMVTSPRALVRGYPWMDTISHELVHLLLMRASADRAPVWLQEGIAKFLERRWRGEAPEARLDPASLAILQHAAAQDRLLPFDRLHPSIAQLPSQEDAALAFAQVATFVDVFHRRFGMQGIRRVARSIAQGTDARDAVAAVAAEPWPRLEAQWRVALTELPPVPTAAPRMIPLEFRSETNAPDSMRDVQDEAGRLVRLGDLLWSRHHPAAAAHEYDRALTAAPDDPVVATRFGRAALAAGDPSAAARVLESMLPLYPDYAPVLSLLGAAHRARGDVARARSVLREAIRINPFDPEPHCHLAELGENEATRARESAFCAQLR